MYRLYVRVLSVAAIAVTLLAGAWLGAAPAQAATVTIRTGDMINDASLFGTTLPSGACSVIAGKDQTTGHNIGITMGHCTAEGNQINKDGFTPVGRTLHAVTTMTGVRQVNKIDVAVIEFNDNVRVIPSGHHAVAPKPGQQLVKHGYGLWTSHIDFGTVTHVYGTDFRMAMQASPFDSGGAVTDSNGGIVGLVSRGFKDYTSADTVVMSFTAALRFISSQYDIDFVSY